MKNIRWNKRLNCFGVYCGNNQVGYRLRRRQISTEVSKSMKANWMLLWLIKWKTLNALMDLVLKPGFQRSAKSLFVLQAPLTYLRLAFVWYPETFHPHLQLFPLQTSKRRLDHPNQLYFLNPECIKNSVGIGPEKFSGTKRFTKNSLFWEFLCQDGKNVT